MLPTYDSTHRRYHVSTEMVVHAIEGLDVTDDDPFQRGTQMLAEGREAIALEHFTAAAAESDDKDLRLAAVAHVASLNISLGRPHEALVWVEQLRAQAPAPDQADLLAAQAHSQLGDGETALQLLDRVGEPSTTHFTYPLSVVRLLRSEALGQAGRLAEAVQLTLEQLQQEPDSPKAWRVLARLLGEPDATAVDLQAAIRDLPAAALASAAGGLVHAPVAGVERLVEVLWERWPGDRRLVALVATMGHRLAVPSALEWSGRLRNVGQGEHCPLLGLAASSDRHPRERVRAAAAAGRTFSDDRAPALLELATTALPDDDLPEAFDEVLSLAPELADSFVVAAAQSSRRALLLARALHASGNTEPALAVARHAAELSVGQPDVWRSAVTDALGDPDPFAAAVEAAGDAELAAALRASG